ncbi:pyridoxal kinase [Vibrio parahaemolyticus]
MKSIISIHSHFVSGYAGNSSAVFPMQKMGMEVWPIHTGQFSDTADTHQLSLEQPNCSQDINALMNGLDKAGKLADCGAVLSGYQRNNQQYQSIIDAVTLVRERNPEALYVFEPEFCVNESTHSMSDEAINFIKQKLVPLSDAVVLSQCELRKLTEQNVESSHQVATACKTVLSMGANMVLVKNFSSQQTDSYNVLLATRYASFTARAPKIDFDKKVNGTGNLFSSLFTACLVRNMLPLESFRHAVNATYGVLEVTKQQDKCELQIIDAQYEFVEPSHEFGVFKVE